MDSLNKHQIVLLCLLIAFVTSIATGISVVSLMQQDPEPVTQTIHRVVETTIEKVSEDEEDEPGSVTVERTPEKEVVTVVVREEDVAVETIQTISPSLARIYTKESVGEGRAFRGLGIVVDSKGTIVTDASIVDPFVNDSIVFRAVIGGKEVAYDLRKDTSHQLAVLEVSDPKSKSLPGFVPAELGNAQNLNLAQSIIAISGKESNAISTGIITQISTTLGAVTADDPKDKEPLGQVTSISTSVDGTIVLPGSILATLQGDIVGIFSLRHSDNQRVFMPVNRISAVLQ